MEHGILVTLEGIDNAGKTTLATRIVDDLRLRGRPAMATRELTTPVGTLLNATYQHTATFELKVLLFAADRIERQKHNVEPFLRRGGIVIADRWVHSAVAYRLAETPAIRRAEVLSYVLEVNRPCLTPTLALYLDLPADASARREHGNMLNVTLLDRVRAEYLGLVRAGKLALIDANRPQDEVLREALDKIQAMGGF